MKKHILIITAFILFTTHLASAQIPSIVLDLENASAKTQNNEIIVSTGKVKELKDEKVRLNLQSNSLSILKLKLK